MKVNLLIAAASWEDRFCLGLERTINTASVNKVVIFYFEEYADWTSESRARAKAFCEREHVAVRFASLKYQRPDDAWHNIRSVLVEEIRPGDEILVDISTMPREAIWTIFFIAEHLGASICYNYNRPEGYSSEWLSRDPDRPRFVYKLSGVATLGVPSILVALTGFDVDRTRQLINFYQPAFTLLGLQIGEQYENIELNVRKHLGLEGVKFRQFKVDAYAQDHGLGAIRRAVSPFRLNHNLIVSSLGPKPSAIALYRLCKEFPFCALAYTPARQFNKNYSWGIDGAVSGSL